MAARKSPPAPRREPARRPAGGDGEISLSTIIKVVGAVAAMFVGMGAIIAPLWGYFSLQRDTGDNKAKIEEIRKQITDGQEKQFKQFEDYARKADARAEAAEKETRRIDSDGTAYGRGKVDTRMQEIAKIDARVDKIQGAFDDLRPIIQRTGDRVEQMWGDYNARAGSAPPLIDARRPPRR